MKASSSVRTQVASILSHGPFLSGESDLLCIAFFTSLGALSELFRRCLGLLRDISLIILSLLLIYI